LNGDLQGVWYVKDGTCYVEYESASGLGTIGLAFVKLVQGDKSVLALEVREIDAHEFETSVGYKFVRLGN